MADRYVYAIDVSDYDGEWSNLHFAKHRQTLEGRDPRDVARGIFERWILDNPGYMAGGERVMVFDEDVSEYPPDDHCHVRIWVHRGVPGDFEDKPVSAAYLVDLPGE